MASGKKLISLRLLVDKENNRVAFAESDSDFVNMLFGFLALPVGTVVRLAGKQSSLGCMDALYESVANLEDHYFQTHESKKMLLYPRSAAEMSRKWLSAEIGDLGPERLYWRQTAKDGESRTFQAATPAEIWGHDITAKPEIWYEVFIKGDALKFMISDDLQVSLVSTATTLSLLDRLGIKDGSALEDMTVKLGKNDILSLLKRCVVSKMPLSEVFLKKEVDAADKSGIFALHDRKPIKREADTESVHQRIAINIIKDKESGHAVYAEAVDEDFIDFMLSFLTLPLGSIMKLLRDDIILGCLNNLYASVEKLGNGETCIISEDDKAMLLDPKLAPHFDISNQMLKINAIAAQSNIVNPKSPDSGTEPGGGFVKRPGTFLVTEELAVSPFSPISGINLAKEMGIPISNLQETVIYLDRAKALEFLKACIVSSKPLSKLSV